MPGTAKLKKTIIFHHKILNCLELRQIKVSLRKGWDAEASRGDPRLLACWADLDRYATDAGVHTHGLEVAK